MKTILRLFFAAALLAVNLDVAAVGVEPVVQASVFFGSIALYAGLAIPMRFHHTGNLNVITDVKVWNTYIIEKLRKVNEFITKSRDESQWVLGGAVVYIPQAGADPVVEINANTYPGVAVRRVDSDINYALDSYRTVPSHIPWSELQTISYNKIDSVVGGHTTTLAEVVADNLVIKWAPTTPDKQIATTGAAIGPVDTQTGNRAGLKESDLAKAMIMMNKDNVPKGGRIALIDDSMYEYFYNSLTATQMNAYNQFADNRSGIVGRLHGFDIYTRTSVLAYAAGSPTAKAYGSVLDATDNLASLCWHPDMVCRAIGDTKPFQDRDNPLYYGDIWSMILRAGGRKIREDNKGVIAIVQAAA
jgi:hypothetical protein